MTKEEIRKEAEKFLVNLMLYWLSDEDKEKSLEESRDEAVEELTEFAYMILNKKKQSIKKTKCHCGQPIDFSNIDCVVFSLCKDCAMDS